MSKKYELILNLYEYGYYQKFQHEPSHFLIFISYFFINYSHWHAKFYILNPFIYVSCIILVWRITWWSLCGWQCSVSVFCFFCFLMKSSCDEQIW